jgi:Fe-S oxidoreductase
MEEWGEGTRHVALFADTFNAYFERENLDAAIEVLTRLGYEVSVLAAADGGRALCCGRTYLSAGLVEQARAEARRVLAAARPLLARGVPIVGLEPSCLLTLRDEFISMLPGAEAELLASRALLLEEFIASEAKAGRIEGPIGASAAKVLLHGHCHQKAFGAMPAIQATLGLVQGLHVETVESSCCGMAGAFGYAAETHHASMAMGELSLLPAVRKCAPEVVIAADGFSCRHQIHDGTGRTALHVSRILRDAMSSLQHGQRENG